jgi:outer membrane protein assembly factor BamB
MKKLFLVVALALIVIGAPDTPVSGQEGGVSMIAVEGEGARYWTRWRGPTGQGLVAGSGYLDSWSATQNVLWKTPVPGRGNSSPIVWGDRVFLTTAEENGAKLSVLAFRRSDGARLWTAVAPAPAGGRPHQKNGHASGTVVVDGERVYASFGNSLAAFDMTGKLVWAENLGRVTNYHGPAGSPLLYKDRIILFQDQSANAYVAAFDARTGKRLWLTPRDATVGWGTPVAVRVGARDEIIVNGQSRVQAYDPATGRELWRVRGTTFEVIPTPVVGHGMVFSTSGRAGPTLAIRPGGSGDVSTSHVAWTTPRGSPFVPSPLLVGQYLYTVNDMASIVTNIDARTGRTVWQGRLGVAQREGFSASPVAVDGKLFFTNDDGDTFVVRAGPTFEVIRVNSIGERTLASPALVDGRWYLRTERHLIAIGK